MRVISTVLAAIKMNIKAICFVMVAVLHVTGSPFLNCPGSCECSYGAADCTMQQLDIIPSCNTCEGIYTLDLSNNNIQEIPAEAFEDYPNLIRLYVNHNLLSHIDEYAFKNMRHLQVIHVEGNYLTTLAENMFSSLSSLKSVSFRDNPLGKFYNFSLSDHMTDLDLSNCGLNTLSTVIFKTQLKVLYLSGNNFESFPIEVFKKLPYLKRVYLHGNPWRCGDAMEELMQSKQHLIADRKKMHCVTSDGEQQVWSQGSWKSATTFSETSNKQTSQSVVVESTTTASHVEITGTSHSVNTAATQEDTSNTKKSGTADVKKQEKESDAQKNCDQMFASVIALSVLVCVLVVCTIIYLCLYWKKSDCHHQTQSNSNNGIREGEEMPSTRALLKDINPT